VPRFISNPCFAIEQFAEKATARPDCCVACSLTPRLSI
jgi:hypothetical protein